MKLISLTVKERTETHILYVIRVCSYSLFGGKTYKNLHCSHTIGYSTIHQLLSNGEYLSMYLRDSINAILSTGKDYYENLSD